MIQIPYQNHKIKSSGKKIGIPHTAKNRTFAKPNDFLVNRHKSATQQRSTFACGVCADPASKNGTRCTETLLCKIKRLFKISSRGQTPPNSLEVFPDFLQNDREPTLPSGGFHPPDPPRKRNEAYTKIIKYIYNFLKVEFIKKKNL